MTPGTILFDTEFVFHDGGTRQKLFVGLNDGSDGYYLCTKPHNQRPVLPSRQRTRNTRSETVTARLPSVTPYVFVTERGGPLTESTVRKMVARAGREAGFPFPVHPHMLRHACGFKLANDGHDTRAIQHYLGHRQIQHTVHYTELSGTRFNGFWKD